MTFGELRKLVNRGETATTEFKRKVAHPEKIVKEIVAFANSEGGYLLIGVSDNGDIPGVKYPEDESYLLNKAITELCHPRIDYEVEEVDITESHTALVYHIPISGARPHKVIHPDYGQHGQVFVRHEDKSVKASKEMREIIRRRRKYKDISFHFGDKEKLLMEYLEEHEHITLSTYRELAQLSYYQASRKLVLLVLANVLNITPTEKGDYYSAKNNS